MKKTTRYLTLLLIIALVFVLPTGIYAEKGSDDDSSSEQSSDDSADHDSNDDSSDSSSDDSSGQGSDDPLGHDSDDDSNLPPTLSGNPEYMTLLAQKEQLSNKIDTLKDQLDSAKRGTDSALITRLTVELRDLKNQKDAVEAQMYQLGGDDRFRSFDDSKHGTESELSTLKLQRDTVERELLRLRTELNSALTSGDTSGAAALQLKIREQEALKDTLQNQIREKRLALKTVLRNLYSDDEWNAAAKLQAELNRLQGVNALPLNSILVSGKEVKFDTPPVISSGRTLIPVRAIAASLGATVLWDESEQKITIQKGTTVIEFEIGDDSMKVNGNSVSLDVPPQIINGRTVIPLRAMIESLGLTIDWDGAIEVLEIQ